MPTKNESDKAKRGDLTQGAIIPTMLRFAFPMMVSSLLQQCYNIADTLIVGRSLGALALSAVGSAYTLMTFITSIFIGLCMGSGVVFSHKFGSNDEEELKESIASSFVLIAAVTITLNILLLVSSNLILKLLNIPPSVYPLISSYLNMIYKGVFALFLFNFSASLLRSLGHSVPPLIVLAISSLLNIILDLIFILSFGMGVKGAALATVISQYISAILLTVYMLVKLPLFRSFSFHLKRSSFKEVSLVSFITSLQQSIMNLGILMIQSLVNSFGSLVMAAFAAAVKIDSIAYLPSQEFGNAFSTFIAQNYGAKKRERIKKGIKGAIILVVCVCLFISLLIFIFAPSLMSLFISSAEVEIIEIGSKYLRIEGAFYFGIGILFLLYGLYRAIEKPAFSLVLTFISLGLRVLLAYLFAPIFKESAIWWAIVIGWLIADSVGCIYFAVKKPLSV